MRGTTVPCAWAALPARFPLASRALEPRFGGVYATRIPTQAMVLRISMQLRAAVPRISMQLEAAALRISVQLEAVIRQVSMSLQDTHSHAFPRNDKCGSVYSHEITNSRFQCFHDELYDLTLGVPRYLVIHRKVRGPTQSMRAHAKCADCAMSAAWETWGEKFI